MKDVPPVLDNLSPRRNSCLPLSSLNIAMLVQHIKMFSPNIFGTRNSFCQKKKIIKKLLKTDFCFEKKAKSISDRFEESKILLIFLSFLLSCFQPKPSVSPRHSHGTARLELFKGISHFWFASNTELKSVWLGRNKPDTLARLKKWMIVLSWIICKRLRLLKIICFFQ